MYLLTLRSKKHSMFDQLYISRLSTNRQSKLIDTRKMSFRDSVMIWIYQL